MEEKVEQVTTPKLIVFEGESGDCVWPAKVEKKERRPECLERKLINAVCSGGRGRGRGRGRGLIILRVGEDTEGEDGYRISEEVGQPEHDIE